MLSYIYSQNAWVMFLSVVTCFVIFSLLGLWFTLVLIPKLIRQKHTELVSYGLATISVFSAVLLAFIAVTSWENYGKAEAATSQEAQLVADVLRSSFVMPQSIRSTIQNRGDAYLDIVINEEWPAMSKDVMNFRRGWDELIALYMDVSKFRTDKGVL